MVNQWCEFVVDLLVKLILWYVLVEKFGSEGIVQAVPL